jgi:AraC-like DNA-binding protein
MEFIGYSRWGKNSKFTHFTPNNTAFEIPLKGDMYITTGDRTRIVKVGQLLILPSGVYNHLRTGPSEFCWKLSCGLCGPLLEQHLATLHFSYDQIITIGDPEKYINHLNQLQHMILNKDENDVPKVSGLTLEFLVQISMNYNLTCDPVVSDAIRIIEFNISRSIKMEEIAEELGISLGKLNILFKNETGLSPKQYQINLRMKNAESALKNSKKTIMEIAFLTGYSSQQKFCNEFVKRYGMSPKHFRQKNSKN